jgi:hypothetical protein
MTQSIIASLEKLVAIHERKLDRAKLALMLGAGSADAVDDAEIDYETAWIDLQEAKEELLGNIPDHEES